MSQLRKIDNIMYFVKDLKKSERFYATVLGLQKCWTDEKYQMIGFRFPESDAEIVLQQNPTVREPEFSFLVDNVEALCETLVQQGHKILKQPYEVRCGKFAVIADPDGNELLIIDLTKFGGIPRYDQ